MNRITIFNNDVSIQAIDITEPQKNELVDLDLVFFDGKKWKFNDCEAMKDYLVANKIKVRIAESAERYPEFNDLVKEIANDVCAKINILAPQIKSDMPYKNQFTLEEVIKVLQERV